MATSAIMTQQQSRHDGRPAIRLSSSLHLYQATRKLVGFQSSTRFAMWLFLSATWVPFILISMRYFDYDGAFKAHSLGSGEWYHFRQGLYRIGMRAHLGAVLPAGLLAVFQFLPVTQRKYKTFHKYNGYFVSALLLFGNVPAMIISPASFGGSASLKVVIGLLAMLTSFGTYKGITTIRKIQLDEHRAWMIRTWAWAGSIFLLRLIMTVSAILISLTMQYYTVFPCDAIAFIAGEERRQSYPACGTNGNGHAAVLANVGSKHREELSASLRMSFALAAWLALFVHAAVAEVYLHYTPAEAKRLRDISLRRQVNAGLISSPKDTAEKNFNKSPVALE